MNIVPRQEVCLALIRTLASGMDADEAIRSVALELALPEESVREIVRELEEN